MFQTLMMICVSSEFKLPSLTSVIATASRKANLNKAPHQPAQLLYLARFLGHSTYCTVRAELITQRKLFVVTVEVKVTVEKVTENQQNQLGLDVVRLIKFISDSLNTQWADNYICNNLYTSPKK